MAFAACNIVPKRAGKPGAAGRWNGNFGEHGTLGGVLEWGFPEAKVEKCFLLNAKASYTLPLGGGSAPRVWVAGENLTDESYEYRPGYPAPGRTLVAGVEVRF